MKRLILITAVILTLCSCSIKLADDYYGSKSDGELSAVISINCSTADDRGKHDGAEILGDYSVKIDESATVFDALKNACRDNRIQLDFKGSGDSVYVSGIDYLYEFDCGSLSGWEYSVDGVFPSVGCNAFKLKGGEKISWLYTCDLGEDIGNKYQED